MTENSFLKFITFITQPWFALLWLGLSLFSYFTLDENLAINMHAITNPIILKSAEIITHFGIGTYYLLATFTMVILMRIWKDYQAAIVSFFLFLSVLIPGIVCDILKILMGRARPTELFHNDLFGFYFLQTKADMWSFPSGHTVTITGLMIAFSYVWPRYWLYFLSMSVLVGASRIILTAHYLSDVMVGMYLGVIIVTLIHKWYFSRYEYKLKLAE